MLRGSLAHALALSACTLLGCDPPARPKGPPPLPEVPAAPEARGPAEAEAVPPRKDASPRKDTSPRKARESQPGKRPATRAEAEKPAARATTRPSAPAPAAPRPAPTAPAPAPRPGRAEKPKQRVVVPHTDHVRPDISDALQADLDADPRMQAWLERAMAVIDGCHAKSRSAVGTIQASLTMHESARPTFVLGSISPQLGGVVACATTPLMRIKMPLFTGREGTRHTLRVRFE